VPAPEPIFELVLLAYRNDLARERTIAFLARLPGEFGGPVAIRRDTALPHTLLAGLDHQRGLRLAGELRERGAQVQLRSADDIATAPRVQPRAFAASKALVIGLAILATLAAMRVLQVRPPALPPTSDQGSSPDVGQPDEPLLRHHLNDRAVELNAAGEFAQAAEHLRAAIREAPGEDTLYANLVTVLRNWAVSEINAGRPAQAVELLRETLEHTDAPGILALMGIAQERVGDWHEAEGTLQRAIQMGTGDPMAFVALGRVYRQQGDRQGAVEMFQRARDSGATGRDFDSMLSRLERELDAEWDFVEFSTPHFRLSFAQGENHAAAQVVSQVLEDAYFAVGRKLDLFPDTPTEVVLYASEDFHAVTQTPDWTGGVYDGRIKLPVRGITGGSKLLERTIRHEYGHVLVTLLGNGRVPVWLNEGIAIWAEEDADREREDWARDTIAGRRLFSLAELDPPFTGLPPDRVQIAYSQSYLAVRLILDDFGERRLLELLRASGSGAPLAASFETILSVELGAFESTLIRKLTT
jgi:tetratricopeptide (TPR) repeat protein